MTAVVILFAMGTNNADIVCVCVCFSAACGGKVELHTERRGVIYSPSWPLNYPPGVNCSWNIQGNRGDVITIRYIQFMDESHLLFIIMINYKLFNNDHLVLGDMVDDVTCICMSFLYKAR